MGVGEARQHATAAEVDAVGARQCAFVRTDAAGDPLACNRESSGGRQRRLHRPDDAVLDDHLNSVCRLDRTAREKHHLGPEGEKEESTCRPTGTWKAPT